MNKITLLIASILFLLNTTADAELNLELPDLNLPNLGSQSSSFTNAARDRQMGLKLLRKFRGSNMIIEDPEVSVWIRSLGNRLTSNAGSSIPIYFIVSKDKSINAFATLGGVIVINAGLILNTNTESELAAVIAHEIAHITQNHLARMIENQKGNNLATGAAILAGILAGSRNPDAGQAILTASLATMAHKQLKFSREAETEADRVGIRILAQSRFNPIGMPNFLNRLEQFTNDKDASITEYLRSHPLTYKRISDTQIRAKKIGAFRGKENISYLYMREKVRAIVNSNITTPRNIPSIIKRYSKAQFLKQQRKYPYALKLTGSTSNKIPEAIIISQLLNKQRKYKKSIQILKPLINIFPDDEVLSIPLAQAYLGTRQFQRAWKLLNEITTSEQTSLEFFEIYQVAARLARKNSQAYRAVANRNIRTGNYRVAGQQLRQAIKLPDATESEILEMQQELNSLQPYESSRQIR